LWKNGTNFSRRRFSLLLYAKNDGRIPWFFCRLGSSFGLFTASDGECINYPNLHGTFIPSYSVLDLGDCLCHGSNWNYYIQYEIDFQFEFNFSRLHPNFIDCFYDYWWYSII